jgi:PAS domain S-box-containing protein
MWLNDRALLAILENIPAAVMVADRDGRIVFANAQSALTLGHPVDHLDSIDSYSSLHGLRADGKPLEPEEYPLARALRGERVPATDYRYLRPDGAEVWLRAAAAPISDDGGQLGASVIFRNVDQEVAAAAKVRQLEHTLREQADALREADHRKDQFLAALSHELRNPLGAMASALQVLRIQEDFAPTSIRALGVLERQLALVSRLVGDLLDVSRISQGKIDLQLDPLDISSLVSGVLETVRPRIEAREQALTLEVPPDPVMVEGDAARLTQVVVNLLNNASKYTDSGGAIAVDVRATPPHAEIVVRDNGIGIPKDMQPKIFEVFTQVEAHRARSEGGLGLGLSLAQWLTQLHGGSVAVHSDGPGQGSEFVVRLPLIAHASARS